MTPMAGCIASSDDKKTPVSAILAGVFTSMVILDQTLGF